MVKSSTIKQRDSLKNYIKVAKNRITNFWGSQNGKAVIIFCNDLDTYQKYCQTSEGAGCSIGTIFGSWIILNKEGLNADVLAHEMSHNELMTRVGWWKTKTKIPTWFDEGVALMLDYRFVGKQDSLQRYKAYASELSFLSRKPIPLGELTTEKEFFGRNELYTKIAYFTSAAAIAKKIAIKGKKEIYNTLNKVNKEGVFEF